ncbi:hypothetical protein Bbelb_404910 [Branchiostoma belcheri]|nr:hypothetical protein Bbelb_404910 [Branchiostoma belcheri]
MSVLHSGAGKTPWPAGYCVISAPTRIDQTRGNLDSRAGSKFDTTRSRYGRIYPVEITTAPREFDTRPDLTNSSSHGLEKPLYAPREVSTDLPYPYSGLKTGSSPSM